MILMYKFIFLYGVIIIVMIKIELKFFFGVVFGVFCGGFLFFGIIIIYFVWCC